MKNAKLDAFVFYYSKMLNVKLFSSVIIVLLLMGCGATPGESAPDTVEKSLPAYRYLDNKGNSYYITQTKLEYTPVSADNTIDGIEDQGRHLLININLNIYQKITAVCEQILARAQKPLPPNRDFELAIPQLVRIDDKVPTKLNIDLDAVRSLNFVIEPYLENE